MAKAQHQDQIVFQWIRTHNLRNIDITLPKNKIIAITWVSWSGKSSLAFDTIYKEWQFRYIESLSSYLRQFFNLWSRPEIDYSSWLSPAIAIEQNKRVWNSRSTVGTLTEVDDYLRLLFAKLWDIHCWKCWSVLKAKNVQQIIDEIKEKFLGEKIYIVDEVGKHGDAKSLKQFVKKNRSKVDAWEWFVRYLISYKDPETGEKFITEFFYLEDPAVGDQYEEIRVYGIYDRVTIEESKIDRLKEDIIKILAEKNKFWVYFVANESKTTNWLKNICPLDTLTDVLRYTDKNYCPNYNISYPEFTTQHFSPNRQEWACPACHGVWETLQVDYNKILDPFSILTKAVLPWRDSALWQAILQKLASKYEVDPTTPWKDLPDWFKDAVLNGDGDLMRLSLGGKYHSMYYKWLEEVLTDQYHKWILTVDFQAMLDLKECPECHGAKLNKEALSVFLNVWIKDDKLEKYNIHDLQNMTISTLLDTMQRFITSKAKPQQLLDRILLPLIDRARTVESLGLGYISLSRQIDTLSWWEIQRLRLAKQLWNKLTWIIYVLDEPTIWLDDGEIEKTIEAIQKLKDMWNTIVVVEHSESFIKSADWIVEVWPWAWDFGWNLLFNGPIEDFMKSNTLTAQYVRGDKKITIDFEHKPSNKVVKINKASKYNLKWIDVHINLWSFVVFTWPSGAGKTTLMYHTLFTFLEEKEKYVQSYIRLHLLKQWYSWSEIISAPILKKEEYEHFQNLALQEFHNHLKVESIKWHEHIKNVIYVDQTSIGKTPRSCPATFIGIFDDIRDLFAWSSDAKMIGFAPWHFSFNSWKWACPECDWYGYKKVELQFLPDTYVPCTLCKWKRYKPEILAIKWHDKNISEILEMYVNEAYELFKDIPFLKEKLQLLMDIGLGYLRMWQPAHTLSWWESQRLKLVKHLLKTYKWHTVYFLDEPTVGLHPSDIEQLLKVLKRFLDKWDTILMIEHDKSLLKFADAVHVIEDGNIRTIQNTVSS